MKYEAVVPDTDRVAKVLAAILSSGAEDVIERRTRPSKIAFLASAAIADAIRKIPGIEVVYPILSEAPSGGQYIKITAP